MLSNALHKTHALSSTTGKSNKSISREVAKWEKSVQQSLMRSFWSLARISKSKAVKFQIISKKISFKSSNKKIFFRVTTHSSFCGWLWYEKLSSLILLVCITLQFEMLNSKSIFSTLHFHLRTTSSIWASSREWEAYSLKDTRIKRSNPSLPAE